MIDDATRRALLLRTLDVAEAHLCRETCLRLFRVAATAPSGALPASFLRRLIVLRDRIERAGNKGPRTAARDTMIRRLFDVLRNPPAVGGAWRRQPYIDAVAALADGFSVTTDTVEGAILRPPGPVFPWRVSILYEPRRAELPAVKVVVVRLPVALGPVERPATHKDYQKTALLDGLGAFSGVARARLPEKNCLGLFP